MEVLDALLTKAQHILTQYKNNENPFLHWLNHFEYLSDFLCFGDLDRVTFLLSMLRTSDFNDLSTKVSPRNILHLSYNDLISELDEMYFSHPNMTAAEERFERRNLMFGESVNDYALVLLKLTGECRPGIITSIRLKNRFVQGLHSKRMKKELQAKQLKHIFSDLVAIALNMEYQEINHIKETMLLPNLD